MLGILNRLSRRLQRWGQGIPALGAYIYKVFAVRMLATFHRFVVSEVMGFGGSGTAIDIGCGTASLLVELARTGRFSYLIGLDISLAMARIARENVYRSRIDHLVDIVVADAHRVPLRSNSIDIAVSTGTLHHLAKSSKFFIECSRIVNDICIVYEFSHDVPKNEVDEIAKLLKRPAKLLKIVSALHGIPRGEYLEGSIARDLREAGVRYRVEFRGPITKLYIYPLESSLHR